MNCRGANTRERNAGRPRAGNWNLDLQLFVDDLHYKIADLAGDTLEPVGGSRRDHHDIALAQVVGLSTANVVTQMLIGPG